MKNIFIRQVIHLVRLEMPTVGRDAMRNELVKHFDARQVEFEIDFAFGAPAGNAA